MIATTDTLTGVVAEHVNAVNAGDLDAIVLMAMRKEPERRYASARQLADDLRAHLDGRPVRARGDSAFYRARTFVRRTAAAVIGAAASLQVA